MARKVRIEYAGACYHVINRGNYRKDVFGGKGAAESFVRCLGEAAERFGWRVHAYVVMRNHFHLAVETPEPNLSVGMQWLQGTWAARFNRLRGEAGRPFQGRFKALHVEPGAALAEVAHYIHLNPVRAKLVPAEQVLEFPFGSLPRLVGKRRPAWLAAGTVLQESGGLPDTLGGWRRYVAYLGVRAEEEGRRREEKFGRLSRGWMIGSAEFRKELIEELQARAGGAGRFEVLGADAQAQREARQGLWEEKLRSAAQGLGLGLERLPRKKSAGEKVRLAAVMKRTTSVTNGWLAGRLQMGLPASVSQYVRRFALHGGMESRAFRAVLSKVNP